MRFAACSLQLWLQKRQLWMAKPRQWRKSKDLLWVLVWKLSKGQKKSELLQSGNVAWPSWCLRIFTYFCLLCFLSYSWYTNLGKEVESKKTDVFLPKIFKCKETGKSISDYIEKFPWILHQKIPFSVHISASLHFLFYLAISQRGTFPVSVSAHLE